MNTAKIDRTEFLRSLIRWGLAGCLCVLALAVSKRWTTARACLTARGQCGTCQLSAQCPLSSTEEVKPS